MDIGFSEYSRLSREVTYPLDTDILLENQGVTFRVTEVQESVAMFYDDGRPYFDHIILCMGPAQTSKGRDHATRRWSEMFTTDRNLHELPAVVKLALIGRDRLVEQLTELFQQAQENTR